MSTYKQLMKAAADLDTLADKVEASERAAMAKVASANARATKAEAQAKTVKTASAVQEVKIGQLAKTAAAKVKAAGLLSSDAQAEAFAAQLRNPEVCLAKLAELTQYISAPKVAQVVVDHTKTKVASADDVWAAKTTAIIGRLNLQ